MSCESSFSYGVSATVSCAAMIAVITYNLIYWSIAKNCVNIVGFWLSFLVCFVTEYWSVKNYRYTGSQKAFETVSESLKRWIVHKDEGEHLRSSSHQIHSNSLPFRDYIVRVFGKCRRSKYNAWNKSAYSNITFKIKCRKNCEFYYIYF